jgi:hypothetical protein
MKNIIYKNRGGAVPWNIIFSLTCNNNSIYYKPIIMAILRNPLDYDFRGHIDKKIVVRQYSGRRTVLSAFPDMTNIKPSDNQKKQRLSFKEAQAFACQYLSDPERKAFYKEKCKPGQRPHNVLISELLKKDQPVVEPSTRRIFIVSR